MITWQKLIKCFPWNIIIYQKVNYICLLKLAGMYELQTETDTQRIYRSSETGTETQLNLLTQSKDGAKWWAFNDLLSIPYIRKEASAGITRYYGNGITDNDLDRIIASQKELLRGNDPEKYEKAYAGILELEALKKETADPMRQALGLCSVYILADDELPDVFSTSRTKQKIERWALEPELQSFFLTWFQDGMNAYTSLYDSITKIALSQEK